MPEVFLLDTNCFIEAENKWYPHSVFSGFWDWLDREANKGNLKSIDKVYKELLVNFNPKRDREKSSRAFLYEWLSKHKSMFVSSIQASNKHFEEIYKVLVEKKKSTEINDFLGNGKCADPSLISVAREMSWTLVTCEKFDDKKNKQGKVKIPSVCKDMNVSCLYMHALWKSFQPNFPLK